MLARKASFPRVGQFLGAGSLAALLMLSITSCESSSSLAPNDMGGVGSISVTSVSPSVAAMAGGTAVAIYGSGFVQGATVAFGNKQATEVTVLSPTKLQAVVPASDGVVGSVPVTIRNPDGSFAVATGLFGYVRVVLDFDAERIAVGTHPVAVIAEDTNGDSGPEIITANDGSQDVSVLAWNLNYKNGVSFATPVGPNALAVADFNGNKVLDIAVACNNASSQDLAILSGNGGGGFLAPVTFAIGRNPTAVVTRDFDGDGKPDLILAPRTGDSVFVLRNISVTPGFAFTNMATYPLKTGSAPSALLLEDLTSDVYPELVTANYADGSISTFIGNSGGVLSGPKNTVAGAQVLSLAAGDLNGDQKKDVAALNFGTKTVTLLKGRADGSFDAGDIIATEKDPRVVAIADIDGDGKLDLVVANGGADSVGIYLGNGTGGFDAPQYVSTGATPYGMVVKDLNLDGKPDIVTANYNSSDVSILRNKTVR
jgi:hypothetical protein